MTINKLSQHNRLAQLLVKTIFVLFLLIVFLSTSALVIASSHSLFPLFSAPENGFVVSGQSLSVVDVVVYKTGYYSVNGSAWQSFSLSGNAYGGNADWLSGSSSFSLPSELSGFGVHFVIVYSCSRVSGVWDCHGTAGYPSGFWQLLVVNNSVPAGSGVTYYVSSSLGSDSNDGLSSSAPWKTLQHAEEHATTPGDVVALKRGDVWSSTLALGIHHGGNAINPIVWDGDLWGSGDNAVITTPSSRGGGNNVALVNIYDCQYLTFKNIIVDGNNQLCFGIVIGGHSDHTFSPNGVQNNENHITIKNCTVKDIGDGTTYLNGLAVETWHNDMWNIKIIGNKVDNIASSGIIFYPGKTQDGGTPAEIRDSYIGFNAVSNFRQYGTIGGGIAVNNKCTNFIVEHNVVGDGNGMQLLLDQNEALDGWFPTNITIRFNNLTGNIPAAWPMVFQVGQAVTAYVYDNVIRKTDSANSGGGIWIFNDQGRSSDGQELNFYHNTIYTAGGRGVVIDSDKPNVVTFKNNIIYNEGSGDGQSCLSISTSGSTVHNHNNYYMPVGGALYANEGANYLFKDDIAGWEPTAVVDDPLFVNLNNNDFHLQSNSPAIDAGVVLLGINDNFQGNNPDIGAFESSYTACIPDTSCATSTCVGETCSDTCGGSVAGALQPDCGSRVCGPAPNGCGSSDVCGPLSSNEDCSDEIAHGSGTRTLSCSDGSYVAGACTVVSCDSGYHQSGNSCVVDSAPPVTGAIIADHHAVADFDKIPACWLERAKQLTLHYAHTSHGSQLNTGADTLESLHSEYKYLRRTSTTPGLPSQQNPIGLRVYDGTTIDTYATPGRYWSTQAGIDSTNAIANTGDYDFSMWSWCGQQSTNTEATVQQYLDTMNAFEQQHPSMRFVYMTGHAEASTVSKYDTSTRNNAMVRQYVINNNKVLYDFADIGTHNPDGHDYWDEGAGKSDLNECIYNGGNWCTTWCNAHPGNDLCASNSCAHSNPLNCNMKARAYWWLMARLAGWDGTAGASCP